MSCRTYAGGCHCGAVRFEVELDLDHVRACDCSVCRKRGALVHRVERTALRLLTPIEKMTVYRWHTGTAADYFCPACGILPFRRPRTFDGWSVNVRCLDGVELDELPVRRVHGSHLP
ncbi:MAG: GFA family protein [Myxococcales bacterium]